MATTVFSALSIPQDDTMEVSSPAGAFDGDIDIDFGDYNEPHQTDDERMQEDGEPVRPPTAVDEVMDDDDATNTITEAVMQDSDEAADQDEELIDYDDEQYQETTFTPTTATTGQEANAASGDTDLRLRAATVSPVIDPVEEDLVRQTEQSTEAEHQDATAVETVVAPADELQALETAESALFAEESATHAEEQPDAQNVEEAAVKEALHAANEQELPPVDADAADTGAEVITRSAETAEDQEQAAEAEAGASADNDVSAPKTVPQPPVTLDVSSVSVVSVNEGPPTPTDTGLHPMTIRYGELEMPLFRSRNQSDGLLKNDNLANVSLSDLIRDCRERLASKTGEDISEDQDLVLGFDQMGMVLVEGSRSAFDTSLQDVLDVYLLLHRNDGHEDIPPLSMTLTVQLKFTSHLNMFKQAASQGQGLASFSLPQNADADEQYDEENSAEHPSEQHQGEELGQEHAQESATPVRQTADNALDEAYDAVEEYNEHEEYPDPEDEEDENHAQEGQEYPEQVQYEDHEEYPDPEDEEGQDHAQEGQEYPEQVQYGDHEDLGSEHDGDDEHTENQTVEGTAAENILLESTASSETLRGDHSNEATDTHAEDGTDEFPPLPEDGEEATADPAHLNIGVEDPLGAEVEYPELEEPDEADQELDRYDEHGYYDESAALEEGKASYDALADDRSDNAEFGEHADDDNNSQADLDDLGLNVHDDDEDERNTANHASDSPLGKRSFEEHADEDELEYEEPELKKAKSG